MELKPNEIVSALSKDDQKILGEILAIEKKRLHIQDIKSNSREEKEILTDIIGVIDRAVNNDN